MPSPIYATKVRYKFLDSVIRKIDSSSRDYPRGLTKTSLERMRDILGARVVVYFPMQLAWVDRLLRSSDDFELHGTQKPKAYVPRDSLERVGLDPRQFGINQRKLSGYSSLHYVIRLRARHAGPRPWFELQVRTLAEELWGEIEHQLGYKPGQDTEFSVRRQFRVISDHLHAIDMHLDFIYDQLQHFQRERDLNDSDLISAENLPKLLSRCQIHISQSDVRGAIDILNSYGIKSVAEFLSHSEYVPLEKIRTTWSVLNDGERIHPLVILHILSSLPPHCSEYDVVRRVRGFADFRRITDPEPQA
ncbi:MAG: GTP pyrophosphokinase [Acidimicrobiales bacterium]